MVTSEVLNDMEPGVEEDEEEVEIEVVAVVGVKSSIISHSQIAISNNRRKIQLALNSTCVQIFRRSLCSSHLAFMY